MKRIFCNLLIVLLLTPMGNAFSQGITKPILREPTKVDFSVPHAQRDEKYIRFLSSSVKISVGGASGSGTICAYDDKSKFAYVISCGHLWDGNKQYAGAPVGKATIIVWYHNGTRLPDPRSYESEVMFWSNQRGYDVSLMRFRPDWIPECFPIAQSFRAEEGRALNSLGCDGGREVARYEVRVGEMRNMDLITVMNSPRPGRSGGGLLTDEGELVGVCWGTSDPTSGNGIGYFTPIASIRKVFRENDHEWLLNFRNLKIPIVDWDDRSRTYEMDFVPMPGLSL